MTSGGIAVDLLIALLGIATMAAGLIGFAWFVLGREVEHLRGMFRADDLGWPRGVQEEDPPPTWNVGRAAGTRVALVADDRVAVADVPARIAVRARIRPGTNRRGGRW